MNRQRSAWLAGLTVGIAAGFATLEIPSLGWPLVVAFAIPALVAGPRLAAIGGLLSGLGTIWVVLLGRVALTCRAPDGEIGCSAPGIETWLAVGGAMLLVGLTLSAAAWRRARAATPR
jgi:hypothetical protein